MAKYVFITGGVVSSLGKGVTSASLALLLKSRGYRVFMQKLDPYLNVDPGTMSPYQHGEVFVTDDGAETDLDLGHYERFAGVTCTKASNYTSGRIYSAVLARGEGVVEAGFAAQRRGPLEVGGVAGVGDALGRHREAVQVVRGPVEDLVAFSERTVAEKFADRVAADVRAGGKAGGAHCVDGKVYGFSPEVSS